MARARSSFVCQECGYASPLFMGRCPGCGAWESLVEAAPEPGRAPSPGRRAPVPLAEVRTEGGGEVRLRVGMPELDRALGGGLVAGSLVLLGGDPGVGKSTLLLMLLDCLDRRGLTTLYVSAEESARQVRLRADRLGLEGRRLHLLAETDLDAVLPAAAELGPVCVVLDSVQTLHSADVGGVPGSVSQVREVASRALKLAKGHGVATVLVGHVTKEGSLAGPKVLEHLVDTVLTFEGDGASPLRVLRATKNRFGATGEVGLWEMAEGGLVEVPDASARLLEERSVGCPGTAVLATLEGSRPLLVEVQALVGRPSPGSPSRNAVGIDRQRVAMLLAVLGKAGLDASESDVFVSAAGGVRLQEPAADLAVLAALASSMKDRAVDGRTLVFGEVGLVGEVRAVGHPLLRLREASRHGFRRAIVPRSATREVPPGVEVVGVATVAEGLAALGLAGAERGSQRVAPGAPRA